MGVVELGLALLGGERGATGHGAVPPGSRWWGSPAIARWCRPGTPPRSGGGRRPSAGSGARCRRRACEPARRDRHRGGAPERPLDGGRGGGTLRKPGGRINARSARVAGGGLDGRRRRGFGREVSDCQAGVPSPRGDRSGGGLPLPRAAVRLRALSWQLGRQVAAVPTDGRLVAPRDHFGEFLWRPARGQRTPCALAARRSLRGGAASGPRASRSSGKWKAQPLGHLLVRDGGDLPPSPGGAGRGPRPGQGAAVRPSAGSGARWRRRACEPARRAGTEAAPRSVPLTGDGVAAHCENLAGD